MMYRSSVRRAVFASVLALALLGAGCGQAAAPAAPTQPAATSTPYDVPSVMPATPEPQPTATETEAPPQAPAAATVDRVRIYLIALEDKGQAGKQIGCEDSVVPVERPIEPTTEPVPAALEQLLSLRDQHYGRSGLYNALYQSDLKVESATIAGGKATIALSGRLVLAGVCDNPRVEAQLQETVLQFPEVQEVEITLNGAPLEQALSLK